MSKSIIANPAPTAAPAPDAPSALSEPIKPAEILDAEVTSATPEELIQGLISALDFKVEDVARLEITPRYTRLLLTDRTVRTIRLDWKPRKADAQ